MWLNGPPVVKLRTHPAHQAMKKSHTACITRMGTMKEGPPFLQGHAIKTVSHRLKALRKAGKHTPHTGTTPNARTRGSRTWFQTGLPPRAPEPKETFSQVKFEFHWHASHTASTTKMFTTMPQLTEQGKDRHAETRMTGQGRSRHADTRLIGPK